MMSRLFLFSMVLYIGCTHKPFVAQLPVVQTCDTVNVSYEKSVQPIIRSNCYSCHATAVTTDSTGGLDLENFASLKSYLQYGFRGDGIYGSKFYHCITHSQLALPMPPTYVVDSCSLKIIKSWINAGAPGN